MRGSIVEADDLYAMLGFSRARDVIRCLKKQGVPVFIGRKGQPWTTIELINRAGGLSPGASNDVPLTGEDA